MLAETVARAAIFISVCQALGIALVSAVLVLFVHATQEYQALATWTQETQAKYEATIAELQKQLSTLEAELQSTSARNSALMGENEKMQETKTKSETTTAELQRQLSTLEAELQSMSAQYRVLIGEKEKIQETHTKSETAIVELQKQSSALQAELQSTIARNRVLMAENEKKQETQAKFETTIAELQKQLSTLEAELQSTTNRNHALVGETKEYMTQIAADTQAREALSLEVTQVKASALALQQELEAKTKAAKDWKDLYLRSSKSPTHRRAMHRGDTESVSVAGIIAEKDQIVKQLSDRLTECYSQLTRASIPGAATFIPGIGTFTLDTGATEQVSLHEFLRGKGTQSLPASANSSPHPSNMPKLAITRHHAVASLTEYQQGPRRISS